MVDSLETWILISYFLASAAVLLVAVGGLLRRLDLDAEADQLLIVGWAAVAVVMTWRTCMLWHDTSRRGRDA